MNKYPHPCKHCGARARIEVHKKGKTKSAQPLYKIRCTCCGISTRYYAVREDRNRPIYEMLLMMFRSANRDRRITNDTR